jgi:glycosyltransferase involved in cell wall biosynthesis
MESKNNTPLISIALATYNGEKYLAEQLDTLVMQTYKNIEIIVSDDGSTDGTIEILKNYIEKYSFLHLYHNNAPHGIKKNFENALKYCKGTYIAFSDQDDIWMLDKIEKLIHSINDYSLIYHNSLFVDSNNNSLNKTFSTDLYRYSGHSPLPFLINNSVSGHALMFHRKLLDIALPLPEAQHHDWWLTFRATDNGGVKYLDEILVRYRQHQNSSTDFLYLKSKEVDVEKIEKENVSWYETCATVKGKYQKFIIKWLKAYKNRNNQTWNGKLFLLYLRHLDLLFYMRKKSRTSNFFHAYRSSWSDSFRKKIRDKKNKKN